MSGADYVLLIAAAFVGLGIAYDVCSWLLWQWHVYNTSERDGAGFRSSWPRRRLRRIRK
jgi:hypothetical protein